MGKAIKWIIGVAAALVVVVIAALLIIPFFVDVKQYKPQIEKMVSQSMGRPFSIGDDIRLSLFPWAGLSFSQLEVGNISGFEEKEFLSVASFEARVKLLPLLSKDVQVKKFIISRPKLVLIKNKDGKVNWAFPKKEKKDAVKTAAKAAPKPEPAAESGKAPQTLPLKAFVVGEFAVEDGTIVWIDKKAGVQKEITGATLRLTDVSVDRPIQLELSAVMDEKPVALKGVIGPVGKNFLKDAIPVKFDVSAINQLDIALDGAVDHITGNQGFDFRIDIKPFSPRKLLEELKIELPVKTADEEALSELSLACRVKGNPGAVNITDGVMNIDSTKATFTLGAKAFEKPDLNITIHLDTIDLDRYLPPAGSSNADDKKQDAKDAEASPMDYSSLRKLVVDATLSMESVKVKNAKMQNIKLRLAGKGGRFRMDPASFECYEGKVAAGGDVDLRTNTPKTKVAVTLDGVQSGKLLKDVMEKDFIEGVLNARIDAATAGDDPDRIKKSLNGKGTLTFSDGAIVGIDLANMVRNVGAAFGLAEAGGEKPRTDFAELGVPFTLKNGVFDTRATAMKSPLIRVAAAGAADLVKETLDFRVEPKFVATLKGQGDTEQRSGVTVPVLVGGTFQEPKFKPDLKGLFRQTIKTGVSDPTNLKESLPDTDSIKEAAKGLLKGLPFGN